MTGITVPVTPGPTPTQLSGAPLPSGAIVYNNDSVNAVWVSSSRNMSPGNGILLGPFATATWATGKQCFACVDVGVTSDVLVTFTDDVTQIDNPDAVATAVALALLKQGIPNVLLYDLIGTFSIGAGSGGELIQTGSYSSIIVRTLTSGFASSRIRLDWYSTKTPTNVDQINSSDWCLSLADVGSASWQLPVLTQSATINNQGAGSVTVTVYGTNREIPGPVQLSAAGGGTRTLQYTGALATGTAVQLTQIDGFEFADFVDNGTNVNVTQFNGMVSWWFECDSTAHGTLIALVESVATLPDIRDNPEIAQVPAGTAALSGEFVHPRQAVEYWFYPVAPDAAATLRLNVSGT